MSEKNPINKSNLKFNENNAYNDNNDSIYANSKSRFFDTDKKSSHNVVSLLGANSEIFKTKNSLAE